MAKIVNLRTARKSRAREDKRRQAAENATRFGRSKSDRAADAQETRDLNVRLDLHKIDRADPPE